MSEFDSFEDKAVSQLYRSYLAKEINDPSVQTKKRDFIREWQQQESAPIFGTELLAPAMVLCLLFVVFHQSALVPEVTKNLQPDRVEIQEGVSPSNLKSAVMQEKKSSALQNEKKSESVNSIPGESSVSVKKVSSDIGSTMVFQKRSENNPNNPVTIIWVFTGGNHS